MTICHHPP